MLSLLLILTLALPQCGAFLTSKSSLEPDPALSSDTVVMVYRPLPGEDFTEDQKLALLGNLQRAFDWWEELAPKPVHLVVSSDPYTYTNTTIVNPLYVIVVDPSIRHDIASYQNKTFQIAIEEQDQEQMIAHELGHVLYNLPDWYITPTKCIGPDIMCGSLLQAYSKHTIGVRSLNFLDPVNHPIYASYIPIMKGGN